MTNGHVPSPSLEGGVICDPDPIYRQADQFGRKNDETIKMMLNTFLRDVVNLKIKQSKFEKTTVFGSSQLDRDIQDSKFNI
ncbi:hypothetical protein [Hyella patelloides]|nr:hypothetical protein [Hyella patelloides]